MLVILTSRGQEVLLLMVHTRRCGSRGIYHISLIPAVLSKVTDWYFHETENALVYPKQLGQNVDWYYHPPSFLVQLIVLSTLVSKFGKPFDDG